MDRRKLPAVRSGRTGMMFAERQPLQSGGDINGKYEVSATLTKLVKSKIIAV
jgi:hypothetical protein